MSGGTRSVTQRIRVPLGFVFGAAFLWFAPEYTTPEKIIFGSVVAFSGVMLRAWASGHIVKNTALATTGPYAHTRNPLYLGSLLLALGFALAAHWFAVGAVVAFWLVVYRPTMDREREFLRSRYGAAYAEYEANVPMFFPRLGPWVGPAGADRSAGFRFERYLRHNEWQAALGFLAVLGWIVFRPRR